MTESYYSWESRWFDFNHENNEDPLENLADRLVKEFRSDNPSKKPRQYGIFELMVENNQ